VSPTFRLHRLAANSLLEELDSSSGAHQLALDGTSQPVKWRRVAESCLLRYTAAAKFV